MASKEMGKLGYQSPLRLPSSISYCIGMAGIYYKRISITKTCIRQAHIQHPNSFAHVSPVTLFCLNWPSRVFPSQ